MNEPTSLLYWLHGKLADAEKAVRCREEMEAVWRSGDDKSWALVARLHGGKPSTRKERLDTAESQGHIAVKCRHEVTMFKEAIALLSENADLRDKCATLEAGNKSLRNSIDCACNALTDSICVSGNDMRTNLMWVRKLKAVIQPPTEQKV